jgi:hypothetical protein
MRLRLAAGGRLPEGIHAASFAEVEAEFGWNEHRRLLLAGLKAALRNLRAAGVRRVYLGGSFLTDEAVPEDVDGCWEVSRGVDVEALDPVLLRLDESWRMREAYGVDFFPDTSGWHVEHLATTRDGARVGVVAIALDEEGFGDEYSGRA